MQELIFKNFEKECPKDNEICLVEFYKYYIVDTEEEAKKRRFMTLTWKELGLAKMPYSGRFVNKNDQIVGAFGVRWCSIDDIRIIEKE